MEEKDENPTNRKTSQFSLDKPLVGLSDWIRMSGLTREEAALIQPGYPVDSDVALLELQTTTPEFSLNGYTISETVVNHAVLGTTLLADPDWALERAMLDAQTNATPNLNQINTYNGVTFGTGRLQRSVFGNLRGSLPNNLSDWLRFGDISGYREIGGFNPEFILFGSDPVNPGFQSMQLFSLEYRITPDSGKFTQFAITTNSLNENSVGGATGELGALRFLAEIYDGTTDQLLGTTELSVDSTAGGSSLLQNLDADSLRIKTYGLKEGWFANAESFFHEFDTVAVLLGDCNQDGVVNFLDVGALISILFNNEYLAEADIDEDGDVDFTDIIPFIPILSQ